MAGVPRPTADQRLALAREWDEVLAQVRDLPGFEDFLRPPSVEELLGAGIGGPVVVLNVSRWRSDALIVTTEGVRAIPLTKLTLDDAHHRLRRHLGALAALEAAAEDRGAANVASAQSPGDYARRHKAAQARRAWEAAAADSERELVETCGWLWDAAVAPVVAELRLDVDDDPSRVWWCPTGPLTLLPVHAAGRDRTWLADVAVSSYTPTVRALVDARRPPSPMRESQRFLVVPALADGTATAKFLSSAKGIDVQMCTTVEEVRAALPVCNFVHFDCHADQDLQDPAQGGLLLPDGVLRVFDLAALPLDGEYAALAACKTAVGGTNLLDESITLAAALHYTGFRHVIGSLWDLSDDAAEAVFHGVYRELTDSGRFVPDDSARALARATGILRRRGARIHDWAALVHIGP